MASRRGSVKDTNVTKSDRATSGRTGKAAKRQNARERIAAQRAAERRRERTRWIVTWSVTGLIVVVLGGLGAKTLIDQNHKADQPAALPKPLHTGSDTAMPPWPAPADALAGARAAGLSIAPMEGSVSHFHAHLDVIVNGKPVPVPANIGISQTEQALSEMHTHDERGVIHLESPTNKKRFILGQFFDEWQVKLTATSIGGLKTDAGHTLTVYVDGKQQTGDPASIELVAHREITLVYGPAGAKVNVPKSYTFQSGE
jgi:hypothetical protein